MFADEETEDSALLGWRTRLIQHAAAEGGRRAKTTITSVTPPVPLIAPWSNPTNNGGANVVAQDGPVGFWTASEVEHSDKMEEDFSAGDLVRSVHFSPCPDGVRTMTHTNSYTVATTLGRHATSWRQDGSCRFYSTCRRPDHKTDDQSFTSWNWDAGVEDLLHSDRT